MINAHGMIGKQEDRNWIFTVKLSVDLLQELTYAFIYNAYLL
jgi:hypothetical protein